ncbi:MAG: SDR family NAD(P)-dependent oxidoreductase [Candidatus Baltobacteraceae bacterium]
MQLRDRVAIVTGASGGIGAPTARAFAAAGAHVVLAAPRSELAALDRLAAEVERFGVRALVVPTDVTIRAEIDHLVRTTLDAFGTIDVLANIAGIGSPPALCDTTDAELCRVIEVNLIGCARMIHAVVPVMRMQRRGAIVNIGSVGGEAGVLGIYSASKFGLRGLNDSVRREVRSWNIEVSLIEPGFVRSNINANMGEGLPSPDIVAREIVRVATRPRRRKIVPAIYVLPVAIAKLFPGFVDLVFGHARIQQRLNRDLRAARRDRVSP